MSRGRHVEKLKYRASDSLVVLIVGLDQLTVICLSRRIVCLKFCFLTSFVLFMLYIFLLFLFNVFVIVVNFVVVLSSLTVFIYLIWLPSSMATNCLT